MAYALEQDNYRSKRSYLATSAFHNSFFTYTTSLNPSTLQQEGRLSAVILNGAALTAAQCPAGRVLRENGRKLYPGVNPGLAVGDTYQGAVVGTTTTNHFFVGVFDAVTGAKGFINPNISTFVVYNSDKPLEIVDQDETNGTGVNEDLVSSGQIRSSSITTSTATGGTLTINPSLGQVFRFTATMASAVTLAATAGTAAAQPGAIVYLIFTNGGGQTIIGDQTTVLSPASATMTNAKGYAVTLVSNGVTFVQTSAVQINV
jgi:hypothetical protein